MAQIRHNILVSVIISTFNGEKYIKRAIESVLSQTYGNIELIIIDDCSTDNTSEIIFGYSRKDSRIVILKNETNIGSYKSLNKAIRISRGKYIANLDDDDIWRDSQKIEKQTEFLEKHNDYGLVGGGMIKIDIKNNEIGRYLFPEHDKDIRKSILKNNLFSHSAVLFRKDAWEEVGGYNELFGYSADIDLWLKIGKKYKFYNFQDYFIYYLDKENSGSYFSRKNSYRRKVWLNIKMIKQYKNDYPGCKKAVLLCWASYFYSFVPYRQKMRPILNKLRALIFGQPSYKIVSRTTGKIKVCCVASVDITLKFMLLNQLKFLQSHGYDVSAVCSPGKWVKDIESTGIKVKTIRFKRRLFSPRSDISAFFQLFFYFRKEKFQIVHTHTPKPEIYGQIAAKLAGVPIIIDGLHGFDLSPDVPWFFAKLFILLERLAARCSDVIFSVSKDVIKRATEARICKPDLLKYLGRDIDTNRFNPERFSEEFILNKKKELGIDPNKRVIGIVARLVEEKGYIEIFKAFKNILDKFPNTLLLSVGPREPEKKDRINIKTAKKYNIEKNVIFLGERIDVEEIYPLMDVFILPTHREGIGASILEASSMEKPVIVSNIGGCPEAVEDKKTGILTPVKSTKEITEAIIYLFDNPQIAKKMGEEGRKKIIREFDQQLVFDRLKTEYQRLIKEKLK